MNAAAIVLLALASAAPLVAQSGGTFSITRSAVAGGGTASSGGPFVLTGTIGQGVAGSTSVNSNFTLSGGFWHPDLAPTSAAVFVAGRAVTLEGVSIPNVVVTIISPLGESLSVRSNPFGYFRFDGVPSGQAYLLSASHRVYSFDTRVLQVESDITDAVLIAMPIDADLKTGKDSP